MVSVVWVVNYLKITQYIELSGISGMVCNIFEILDEGVTKKLCKVDYKMKYKMQYVDYCRMVINSMNETISVKSMDDDLNEIREIVRNPKFIEPHGLMIKFQNKYMELNESFFTDEKYWRLKEEYCGLGWDESIEEVFQKHFKKQDLLDYLGIIPFTPSVMINISPDWSGIKRSNPNKVQILKGIFENYMKEEWYDRWEYVIENGSNGDHIHLHAVCHMNVKRLKSVETHLRVGRHSVQLQKYAKKLDGMGGILKGTGIQKTFCRTEEIVKDKLLYLHEDTKPQGHKNKSIIKDGYIVGCL